MSKKSVERARSEITDPDRPLSDPELASSTGGAGREDPGGNELVSVNSRGIVEESSTDAEKLHPITNAAIEKALTLYPDKGEIAEGQDKDREYAQPNKHSKPHGEETLFPILPPLERKFFSHRFREVGGEKQDYYFHVPREGSHREASQVVDQFIRAVLTSGAHPPEVKRPSSKNVSFSQPTLVRLHRIHTKEIIGDVIANPYRSHILLPPAGPEDNTWSAGSRLMRQKGRLDIDKRPSALKKPGSTFGIY